MAEKTEQQSFIINGTTRDNIVKYLDSTSLPHDQVKTIISALEGLEPAESNEEVTEEE